MARRNDTALMSRTELLITEAMEATEAMGADERLTEAVVLLMQARDKVADFVEREFE